MNRQNPTNSKWGISIAIVASIISLLLSVAAVCRSYCRTEELGVDYLGIIVGVLAILVTCLVAWNIYTIIDVKSEIKKMKDEQNAFIISMEEKEDAISKRVYHTQAGIHKTAVSFKEQFLNPKKERFSTSIIIDMIAAIDALSKAGRYGEADIELSNYAITINENSNAIKNGFDKELKNGILRMLYDIPNRKHLPSFEKFEKQVIEVIGVS